jgi:hypothetical protein
LQSLIVFILSKRRLMDIGEIKQKYELQLLFQVLKRCSCFIIIELQRSEAAGHAIPCKPQEAEVACELLYHTDHNYCQEP